MSNSHTRPERLRAGLFLALLLALMGGLVARLWHLQVKQHAELSRVAKRQHSRMTSLQPWRGDITMNESGRKVLVAGSVGRHSLLVHGRQKRPRKTVEVLSRILKLGSKDRGRLWKGITRGRAFWFRRRRISHTEAAEIRGALGHLEKYFVPGKKRARYRAELQGVELSEEAIRLYPFGSLAAHVLGTVNVDGKGLCGIESSFQEQLEGLSGLREFEVDNKRHQLTGISSISVPALHGYTVNLSLDRRIQHFLEEALDKAAAHWKPAGISVVAIEPSTGRILAMASRPTFTPDDPSRNSLDAMRNRVLTDPYEPGSTIKPLFVSRVWQLGRGHPLRPITLPRLLKVKRRSKPIRDSHKVRVEGRGTQERDVITQSSNVGSYLLSSRLDDLRFLETLKMFGLGRRGGLPISGEAPGSLALARKPHTGNRAAVAQGYGILVTPLQMALAYSVFANGGTLYAPRLVDSLVDTYGRTAATFAPRPVARILTNTVAHEWMAKTMATVVSSRHGTARRARLDGYSFAGKTGTSKKLVRSGKNRRRWRYSESRTICSFVGFAPVKDARITITVVVDDPTTKHGRTFGGNVAAPIAAEVVGRTLNYLGVPKAKEPEQPTAKERRVAAAPKRRRRRT